jgi:rSAM/selenodomain-associated transferase 2
MGFIAAALTSKNLNPAFKSGEMHHPQHTQAAPMENQIHSRVPNKTPTARKAKVCLSRGIGLVVSGILMALVFRSLEPGALLKVLGNANWQWTLLSLVMFGVHLAFASYRWHLMLRLSHATIHPGATLRAVTLGHSFNTFLFGTVGGDMAKSMIYARWYRLSLSKVLAMAPLDRFFGLTGALAVGISMAAFGYFSGGFDSLTWSQLSLPVFWTTGLMVLLLGSVSGLSLWHGKGKSPLGLFMNHLRKGAAWLWEHPGTAMKATLASMAVHLCLHMVMVFNLKAVTQASFVWWDILWIFPVISIIASLPISLAGAGLREGSALVLLAFYSIPGADAVSGSLLTLGVYTSWALVGLALWRLEASRHASSQILKENPSVSIVIPVLNEAGQIHPLADHLQKVAAGAEWILADGGSTDKSLNIMRQHGFKIVQSQPGRGIQMHAGAAVAKGDIILFLHADTRLPGDGLDAMLRCLRDPSVVGGGFWKRFDQRHWLMTGSRLRCLPRIFIRRFVFGDQGLFVRRQALKSIGGVPEVPLMEEFELCRKLRQRGRMALADATVTTSSRKFLENGVLNTYWLMARIQVRYWLGDSPTSLAKCYHKKPGTD